MITFSVIDNNKVNVNLSDIEVSEFERDIRPGHVKDLKEAISSNKLVDDIITVVKKNKKYFVIDGQHRLQAAMELSSEDNKDINLKLRVVEKSDNESELDIYFNMQKGIPATINDYTKGIDKAIPDLPFFSKLRDNCTHYPTSNQLAYSRVLQAYIYSTRAGLNRSICKKDLKDMIVEIPREDIEKIRQFLFNYRSVMGYDTRDWTYRNMVFANLMRLYFQNFEDNIKIVPVMKKVIKDRYLKNNSQIRSREAFYEVFRYMEKNFT